LEQWFKSSGQPEAEYWIKRLDHISDYEYRMRAKDEADPKLLKTDSENEYFESERDEFDGI
jgi:hypothetical protein